MLLPVWSNLPDDDVRVWRIATPGGQDLIARIVPSSALADLLRRFGLEGKARLTATDLVAGAAQPQGIALHQFDGARLIEVTANGRRRLEFRGFPPSRLSWLKSLGCFTEIIAFRTRLFLPRDRATAILEALRDTA